MKLEQLLDKVRQGRSVRIVGWCKDRTFGKSTRADVHAINLGELLCDSWELVPLPFDQSKLTCGEEFLYDGEKVIYLCPNPNKKYNLIAPELLYLTSLGGTAQYGRAMNARHCEYDEE